MGVGSGLYMFDVIVKRSRSLSHVLMSYCLNYFRCRTAAWQVIRSAKIS